MNLNHDPAILDLGVESLRNGFRVYSAAERYDPVSSDVESAVSDHPVLAQVMWLLAAVERGSGVVYRPLETDQTS